MAYLELEPWEKKRKKETQTVTLPTVERKYQEQASTQAQRDFKPPAPAEPVQTAVSSAEILPERKYQEQRSTQSQRNFAPITPNSPRRELGRAQQVETYRNSAQQARQDREWETSLADRVDKISYDQWEHNPKYAALRELYEGNYLAYANKKLPTRTGELEKTVSDLLADVDNPDPAAMGEVRDLLEKKLTELGDELLDLQKGSLNLSADPDGIDPRSDRVYTEQDTVSKLLEKMDAAIPAAAEQQKNKQNRDADFKDLTVNSFKRGYYNAKYGEESFKELFNAANESELYRKLLEGDDYNFVTDVWWEDMLSNSAEQFGQLARQVTNPRTVAATTTAAATGAVGAAVLGQAGPQALVPEEAVTVPISAVGFGIPAFKAAVAASNVETEVGLAYAEMRNLGLTSKTARTIALAVGGINGALEKVQLDELAAAYRATAGKAGTQLFAEKLWNEAKRRFPGLANNVLQEVLQEGTTAAGVSLASKQETGKWAYDRQDILTRLGDTAYASLLTFGALEAPAAVANIAAGDRPGGPYRTADAALDNSPGGEYNKENGFIIEEKNYRGDSMQKTPDIGFQFFANRSIPKQTDHQLRKSLGSWSEVLQLHQNKIDNPELYDSGWGQKSEVQKTGLIRHWEKEIQTLRDNIDEANEELRKRGVK